MHTHSALSFRSVRVLLASIGLLLASTLAAGNIASADVLNPLASTGGSGSGSGFTETVEDELANQIDCPCILVA